MMKKTSCTGVSSGSLSKPTRGRKFRNTLAECTEVSTDQPESLERMASSTGLEDLLTSMRLQNSSKEVVLCTTGWISYLKALKCLISAGSQLTFYLSSLTPCRNTKAAQLQVVWEQLMTATNDACMAVKKHITCTMQDVDTNPEIDVDQIDINQQAMCNSLSTLIHLQIQFSSACNECLKHMATCSCDPPHPPPSEVSALIRSYCVPPKVKSPNFPHPPQRRWSEAATGSGGATSGPGGGGNIDPTLRRWSMPWKLSSVPPPPSSRSSTPDTGWSTALINPDDLTEVINIMSLNQSQPTQQLHYPLQNLPGVVLTRADSQDMSTSYAMSPRGSWWSEADEMEGSVYLTSRKSSSSTDTSSSCYSLHSRSASSSEESGGRPQFFSVCSGSDLPFVKLPTEPETNEPTEADET